MQEHQRELILREQLKVIQKELGISKDDRTAEADKFRERLETLTLPEAAQKRIDEEMEKFSRAGNRFAGIRHHAQLPGLADRSALGQAHRRPARS